MPTGHFNWAASMKEKQSDGPFPSKRCSLSQVGASQRLHHWILGLQMDGNSWFLKSLAIKTNEVEYYICHYSAYSALHETAKK